MLEVISRRLTHLRSRDGVSMPGRYAGGKRRDHWFEGRGALVYPDGTVEWEDGYRPNVLMDEGEASIIDDYLKGGSIATKYLALVSATPADETKTMASPTFPESETPGSDNYARQQVLTTDWGANTLSSGDYQSTAAEKTFGANGGTAWTLAAVAMVTVSTGTGGLYIAYIATATASVELGVAYKFTWAWKNQ